jgi:hypothetical protein
MEKYPKVYALGHKYIQDILQGETIVEEKIDGSQFNFNKNFDGELFIYSRAAKLNLEAPDGMFKNGVDYIISIKDKLTLGFKYHGEYLQKPKHNVLPYSRIPNNHIIIFDIENEEGIPLNPVEKRREADRLNLETVPKLMVNCTKVEDLFNLLETPSILGNETIEGVVVKNYNKYTQFNTYYVGKYVSEKYKERHQVDWKEKTISNKNILEKIIDTLKTEARWQKAIQHLKESGEYLGEPKDIGKLLPLINEDIETEEQDLIKEMLYNYYIKDIKRVVFQGFPEWYKKKLMENLI